MHIKCDICATDFMISIFADPIYKGDWPASVKERSPPNLLPITPDLVRPSSWLCLSGLCIRVTRHLQQYSDLVQISLPRTEGGIAAGPVLDLCLCWP